MAKKNCKYYLLFFSLLGVSFIGYSQVGIGTKTPSSASMLHVEAKEGDRGVLLPKVKLTSLSSFKPINGNGTDSINIGLVVFNENETKDILKGYYYWTGKLWTRIVDAESIDMLVPTLPSTDPNDKEKKNYVIFNEAKQAFFTVEKKEDGTTVLSEIAMDEIVKKHETNTFIDRRFDDRGVKGRYEINTEEPEASNGAIIYRYTSEEIDDKGKRKTFYINMTEDIYKSIEDSKVIQDVINTTVVNNLTNDGNVYFGDIDGKDVLYILHKDKQTGKETTEIIDIKTSVLDVLKDSKKEILKELMDSLGYDITYNVVHTGNYFNGKEIYSFTGFVNIEEGNSETKGINVPNAFIEKFGKVFSIKLYDLERNYINVGITDTYLSNKGTRIEFSLGFGGIFTVLPEGTYSAVVEFTVK